MKVLPPAPALLTLEALSILLGVPAEEVDSTLGGFVDGDGFLVDPRRLPVEWQRLGRRRAREAMAATGTENALAGLWFWAERERPLQELWQNDTGIWLAPLRAPWQVTDAV